MTQPRTTQTVEAFRFDLVARDADVDSCLCYIDCCMTIMRFSLPSKGVIKTPVIELELKMPRSYPLKMPDCKSPAVLPFTDITKVYVPPAYHGEPVFDSLLSLLEQTDDLAVSSIMDVQLIPFLAKRGYRRTWGGPGVAYTAGSLGTMVKMLGDPGY